MKSLLTNLRQVFLNFRLSPKKALLNSYNFSKSNETSFSIIFLLALMSGLGNILAIKFIPIKAFISLDKVLAKYNLGGIGDYFKNSYKPNLSKYFFIGIGLFCVVFLICTVVSYAIRTNLFKSSDNFFIILKITSITLIPSLFIFLIAGIAACLSILLYLLFLVLSIVIFIIYFYEHLTNLSNNSKDALCFVCSITVLVILFIIFKFDVNKDIMATLMKQFSSFFNDGISNLLN